MMIIIFEQDTRKHGNKFFWWIPKLFIGNWRQKTTFRIGWGLWTISYYPEPGLKDFTDYIAAGNIQWYYKSQK